MQATSQSHGPSAPRPTLSRPSWSILPAQSALYHKLGPATAALTASSSLATSFINHQPDHDTFAELLLETCPSTSDFELATLPIPSQTKQLDPLFLGDLPGCPDVSLYQALLWRQ